MCVSVFALDDHVNRSIDQKHRGSHVFVLALAALCILVLVYAYLTAQCCCMLTRVVYTVQSRLDGRAMCMYAYWL